MPPTPVLKKTYFDSSGEILWDSIQLRWRTRRRQNLQLPSGEVTCRHEESRREKFPYILSGEAYLFLYLKRGWNTSDTFLLCSCLNNESLGNCIFKFTQLHTCEEDLQGDFWRHWIRHAIWLQEAGQSVFILYGSWSPEEMLIRNTFCCSTVSFTCKVEQSVEI